MKLLISANTSFNLVNFRAGLIRALQQEGHEIVLLAPFDEYTAELEATGCQVVGFRMDQRGVSPPREAATLVAAYRHLRRIRPDAVLSYTIKNNLYLGLAARHLGIPLIPNITGLGSVFSKQSLLNAGIRKLYAAAFRTAPVVFFQNREDRDQFLAAGIVPPGRAALLPGSGVDLARFAVLPMPAPPGPPAFLLAARLLWEKGIGEFVEAARAVRRTFPDATFRIIGRPEAPGAAAVPAATVSDWAKEGIIDYPGPVRDVIPYIRSADCVVLPSYYREGTPRILLESAACGRPVITTDMPGCRDVVADGTSGFLVRPRDAGSLSEAMLEIARMSLPARQGMGAAGRALIEAQYDERFVIQSYTAVLDRLAASGAPGRAAG
ncbi:glycosyltransferase family 4 protein [Leisingera aquaemixtae]|uniref:glycosyltransferase family 4 protein n=1 Tax=Leisingera aquaemixtae TaxID=1396826 RepID=UPI001C9542BC|nr:glycosyltransferase family 4 protein [Leisingera aquaemixtae]MBY6069566.1 glycosyltransferase family 4 protein [Leisingera aquaemixtae]